MCMCLCQILASRASHIISNGETHEAFSDLFASCKEDDRGKGSSNVERCFMSVKIAETLHYQVKCYGEQS